MSESLFIANCTAQVQDFSYRIPESPKLHSQSIPIGGQIELKNLNPLQVEAIIRHHAKYGMVSVGEIDRTKPFAGLCYSLGKPITINRMQAAIEHNFEVLEARGEEQRAAAAIATHQRIEQEGSPIRALEMEVVEEKAGKLLSGVDNPHKPVAKGVRVDRTSSGTAAKPEKGRRKRGAE